MRIEEPPRRESHRPIIQASHYMASACHYLATAAAVRILDRGGNATDAGVAAGLATNVVFPEFTGIGGVAPIMVYDAASRSVKTISGVGTWSQEASIERFRREHGGSIPIGPAATVVPAAVDAWLTALATFGTLSLAEVAAPAIELCFDGFPMYGSLHRNLTTISLANPEWASTAATFFPGGAPPVVGSVLQQTDLGRTLELLVAVERDQPASASRAERIWAARDAFYTGEIAAAAAEFITALGGYLTLDDMRRYRSSIEEPVVIKYGDETLYACGAWSQGPTLPAALKIIEGMGVGALVHNGADYIHQVSQAIALAFADRERYIGDPRFVDVPVERLISDDYAAIQRERIKPNRRVALDYDVVQGGIGDDDPQRVLARKADADTSYVCVVDRQGNAFSATPSCGASKTPLVPGYGFACSGRGIQSWLTEGHPSSVAPGKRPRLTPNPAIVIRADGGVMPFGTPGGDMQVQTMAQVFLNLVEFGMSPQEAVEQPRFGDYDAPSSAWPHKRQPETLKLEGRIDDAVAADLAERGHTVKRWPDWTRTAGSACLIRQVPKSGTLQGAADARAEATAFGW